MFGAALLSVLTGCVGYVDGPPPAAYVQSEVVVSDDYVYYPAYQVYYSGSRRQYVYREGSAWVSRPAPPHVSVGVLFASPSVRVDFHDAPAAHHAAVVQTYPRNWTPPGWNHGNKGEHKEDRNEDRRQNHRKDD
jgi:hypothetical protein